MIFALCHPVEGFLLVFIIRGESNMEMPTYIKLIKVYSQTYYDYEEGRGTKQAGADALEAAMAELYIYYAESGGSLEEPDFEYWAHEMIAKHF